MLFTLIKLWKNAKPKHRAEFLTVYFFINSMIFSLYVSIPRAFMSLLDNTRFKLFGFNFGLAVRGVQCIVYDYRGNPYYGKRAGDRAKRWLYDIGVAGMSSVEHKPEEIHEEFGLDSDDLDIEYAGTVSPADGASCIIDIYRAKQKNNKIPASIDGTYEYINILPQEHFKEEFFKLPNNYGAPYTKGDSMIVMRFV